MKYKDIFFPEIRGYKFNPQPDITAYELALLLPLMQPRYGGVKDVTEKLSKMPPTIMRHVTVLN